MGQSRLWASCYRCHPSSKALSQPVPHAVVCTHFNQVALLILESIMAVALDEIKNAAKTTLQSSANRYGRSAVEYGHALLDFGSGSAGAGDVAKASVELALRGAMGAVEDSVRFGTAYVNWAYALVGIGHPLPAASGAPCAAAPQADAPAAAAEGGTAVAAARKK
ncbi:hypothetical protein LXA47_17450 [Massilia sp. P8910]|nr:hypothetical protein [Massilia antarctica]